MDRLESAGQQRVHAVFNGILVSHIVDVDGIPQLANSLNATFPLFKPSWVPRQVEVNQGSERLQIQPFAAELPPEQEVAGSSPARRTNPKFFKRLRGCSIGTNC